MSPGLAALAVAVVAGAVVAISTQDARLADVGLLAMLALAPLLASPLPDLAATAARIVGATLAAYTIGVPLREHPATRGSMIGWPAECLAAGAAALAGATAHDTALGGMGPAAATAAGFALLALAAGPLLERGDLVRQGIGALAALTGADLVRTGLAGTPTGLESITIGVAVVAIGAAVALAASQTIRRSEPLGAASTRSTPRP